MGRVFSEDAYAWLQNYHGSIDSTALLMAYDDGQQAMRRKIERRWDEWIDG